MIYRNSFLTCLCIACLSTCMVSCQGPVKGRNGVVYKTAAEYNDYIINRQLNVVQDIVDFSNISKTDLDSSERLLVTDQKITRQMTEEIKGMPVFEGDSTFRDAAVNLFSFYSHVFGNEYRQIIEYRKKAMFLTTDDLHAQDSIIQAITLEEEGFDKALHNAQQRFAEKNHVEIRQTERAQKLEQKLDQQLNK
jgi:hypothetical protein